jgi:hypothetical protein
MSVEAMLLLHLLRFYCRCAAIVLVDFCDSEMLLHVFEQYRPTISNYVGYDLL